MTLLSAGLESTTSPTTDSAQRFRALPMIVGWPSRSGRTTVALPTYMTFAWHWSVSPSRVIPGSASSVSMYWVSLRRMDLVGGEKVIGHVFLFAFHVEGVDVAGEDFEEAEGLKFGEVLAGAFEGEGEFFFEAV